MGELIQQATPMDGEILQDAPMGKEICGCPPLSIWSEVVVIGTSIFPAPTLSVFPGVDSFRRQGMFSAKPVQFH